MAFTEAQRAAIDARNPELLVSAAAGSGKTSVLIERIVSLLERDHLSVDRMLIVTFTRAAACEMRDRLSTRLNEAGLTDRRMRTEAEKLESAQIGTIHGFCTKLVREYFQLVDIDPQATICDDILATNLLNESLDETLTALYELAAENDDVRTLTSKFEERQLSVILLELHRFMGSLPEPRAWLAAQSAHEFTLDDLRSHPMANALLADCRMILGGAAELCDELRALLPTANIKDVEAINSDAHYIDTLIAAVSVDLATLLQAHQDKPFVRMPVFRKAEEAELETHALYKEARARLDDLNKQLGKRLPRSAEGCIADLRVMQPALRGLALAAGMLEDAFAAHKADRSVIDFNDLEHMSLRILANDEARAQLVNRFDAIFVDEYQDVSAIQEAILNGLKRHVSRETHESQTDKLANIVSRETPETQNNEPADHVSRETPDEIIPTNDSSKAPEALTDVLAVHTAYEKRVDAEQMNVSRETPVTHPDDPTGNVSRETPQFYFYVGDVKQSIYRFRQADPTLFQEKLRTFSPDADAPCRRISLNRNFRSRETVLDSVNRVFRRVMRADVTQIDYDADAMLYPGRPSVGDPATTLHVYADGSATAADKPAIEALEIARMLRERVGKPHYDKDGKPDGTIRYRDCAILMPVSKGISDVVERVLTEQGIPVYSEDHKSGLESDEIRQALGHLRLLANERDDLSLLAELRGPIYAWTDAELARVRLLHPEGDYLTALRFAAEQPSPIGERSKAAIDGLARERFLLRSMPLDEYLWDWLSRSGLFGYYGCQNGGRLRQANLRMLCHKASEHAQRGGDLTDFITSVTALAEVSDKTSPTVLSPWEDVVRLMTIHKSKGLEFPITFVMGLGNAITRRAASGDATMHPALGVALRYVNEDARVKRDTVLKSAIDLRSSAEERAERARVLYVAMTRARDELILLGSVNAKSGWQPELASRRAASSYAVWQAKCLMDWVCDAITPDDAIFVADVDGTWECVSDAPDGMPSADVPAHAPSDEIHSPIWNTAEAANLSTMSTSFPQKTAVWRVFFHNDVSSEANCDKNQPELRADRVTDEQRRADRLDALYREVSATATVTDGSRDAPTSPETQVSEAIACSSNAPRVTDTGVASTGTGATFDMLVAAGAIAASAASVEASATDKRDTFASAVATVAPDASATAGATASRAVAAPPSLDYAAAFAAPFGAESAFDDPIAPKLAFTHEPFKLGVTALCRAEREAEESTNATALAAPLVVQQATPEALHKPSVEQPSVLAVSFATDSSALAAFSSAADPDALLAPSIEPSQETVETKRMPFPQARPRTLGDLPRYPSFMQPPIEQSGARRGSATHKALSLVDYAAMRASCSPAAVGAELDRLSAARLLSPDERAVVNATALSRFFGSPIGQDALAARVVRREWSFNLLLPELCGTIAQGVLDLCWLSDGAWRLVDYKTDRVGSTGELWAIYARQIAYYRRALTDATEYPVRDATLFSLSLGEAETRV